MTSIVHAQEGEVLVVRELAGLCAVYMPRFDRSGVEPRLARPRECMRPSLVPQPVADEVKVAGIDEHVEACFQEVRDVSLQVLHPVILKALIHNEIAG